MMTSSFTVLLLVMLLRMFDDVRLLDAHDLATSGTVVIDSPAEGVVADEVHIEYHPGSAFVGAFGDWSSDWSVLTGTVGGRLNQARCVDIPSNMTLCRSIGYNQMRLPNLLDHESISEATHQASSWVALLNIRCHADTQMFLCSLFAPVCLDRPIWPCRTLCVAVQQQCETRMIKYGFPWPDMLRCDRFPVDNDLCIGLQTSQPDTDETICPACNQPETFEGIIDSFCSSEFAIRVQPTQILVSGSDIKIITANKKKVYKSGGLEKKELRGQMVFYIENGAHCQCNILNTDRTVSSSSVKLSNAGAADSHSTFLVIGNRKTSDRFVLTFIQALNHRSPNIARAMAAMRHKTVCNTSLEAAVAAPLQPYAATGRNKKERTTTTTAATKMAGVSAASGKPNKMKVTKRKEETKKKDDRRRTTGRKLTTRDRKQVLADGGSRRSLGSAATARGKS